MVLSGWSSLTSCACSPKYTCVGFSPMRSTASTVYMVSKNRILNRSSVKPLVSRLHSVGLLVTRMPMSSRPQFTEEWLTYTLVPRCTRLISGEWSGKTAGGSAKPMRRGSVSRSQKDGQVQKYSPVLISGKTAQAKDLVTRCLRPNYTAAYSFGYILQRAERKLVKHNYVFQNVLQYL